MLLRYLEKTDPAARVWDGEMLIIVKMNVSEEPGVSELSSRTVKPLRAAQVTTCRGQQRTQSGLETETTADAKTRLGPVSGVTHYK